ncbi:uncharacterized protein [Littorina saxatilis]|uniref:Tumor protein p53-inducible nuclear protein 1 n=1 Tax=Littorina saxatilis TaxID=31220 RepID=A0AAN9BYH1_9CAEN
MFGRLNDFLFGSSETDNAAVDGTQASQQVDLDTKEGDMGWELVVVPGKDDCVSPVEAGKGRRRQKRRKSSPRHQVHAGACGVVRDSSHLPSSAATPCSDGGEVVTEGESRSSDCESQDSGRELVMWDRGSGGPRLASQLGESWIVTPPPCFTGTGSINTHLSSSPLENLLIEHPSMSVYNSLQDHPEQEESLQPEEMEVVRASEGAAMPTRVTRSSVGVAQQIKLTRCHQRKQQVEGRKQLSRKNVERSNKARVVHSTCGKQVSARNRVLRPSGCMSGRRTQRAF